MGAVTLSWGLVVATKDRIAPLERCVTLALAQSPPPVEVIIVDASADWEENARRIAALVAPCPDVRLVHEAAPRPSSATQRNLGIERAKADILFLIDDDSFLFPTTVADVLAVYEADPEEAVAGVQLTASPTPPGDALQAKHHDYRDFEAMTARSPLGRRLLRKLLVYGLEESFIPYDDDYPDRPIPPAVAAMGAHRARLFEGFRMTFRRAVLQDTRFDPLLLYYCPGEDLELSYRLSRGHCLVTSPQARVHHFNSSGARLKRYQVALLESLNQAVFLRQHAPDQRQARQRYRVKMLRRILAELIKDLGQGRFGLPKTRARVRALILSARVFRASLPDLAAFYPGLQERIVRGHTADRSLRT